MPDDFTAKLKSLEQASTILDEDTDALNDVLDNVNERIFQSGVGVRFDLDIEGTRIGFAKVEGTWGLFHYDGNDKKLPIKTASRRVRILCLDHLDEILDGLLVETQKQTEEVKRHLKKGATDGNT